ncbi:MAG: esterase-like activity of phytase family protein [Celeribacter sp.]
MPGGPLGSAELGAAPVSVPFAGEGEDFGGWSGLEVSADGRRFTTLSDHGSIGRGTLTRTSDGRLTGTAGFTLNRLRDTDGTVTGPDGMDAEGLALGQDGQIYISFEGDARIWSYTGTDSPAAWLPRTPGHDALQQNSGLEALAIDARERLYTLPERSGSLYAPFPVWRYSGGDQWEEVARLRRDGLWMPVGADFGPEGRFYLLERSFNGFGFASRIRRFAANFSDTGGEILYKSSRLTHGNLEGLAIWRDGSDALRAVMMTDNNFRPFQRSEIVEVTLRD